MEEGGGGRERDNGGKEDVGANTEKNKTKKLGNVEGFRPIKRFCADDIVDLLFFFFRPAKQKRI